MSEIYQGVLGTSAAAIATTAADENTRITLCKATNTSASDATVSFWAVDDGGGASDATIVLSDLTIPAGETLVIDPMHGEFIAVSRQVLASASAASAITMRVIGRTTTTA